MNIAEKLLEKKLVTDEQYAEGVALHREQGLRIDLALLELGHIAEERLIEAMGEHLSLEIVPLLEVGVDVEALRSLPSRLVHRKKLVPISRHDGKMTVATSDPYDLYAFDELRLVTGMEIVPVLATRDEINEVIRTQYGVGGDTVDEMISADFEIPEEENEDTEDLLEQVREASVVKLVNEIFLEAINARATDIHIEPYENRMSIRFRIDGVLQPASLPPQIDRFRAAITSRIKIMAGLNIAEKRLPQDGRIDLKVGRRQVDVRVSVIPMLFGEGIVMRLLDKAQSLYTLPELGMAEDSFKTFRQLITRPHGIVLVTGPTGCGKTTTLYAALQEIASPEIKVVTIEDPVEYQLENINQIQTHSSIGLTFASGLRSVLRHDPDVVLIGEIRDIETAHVAVQASMTGHLVFSTLHTNDAASAATRLIDMGVEPYLVNSTLAAVMAQRLVRTICSECREYYRPNPSEMPADLQLGPDEELLRGAGCRKCRGTGYFGRTGMFELMTVTEAVQKKIAQRSATDDIEKVAVKEGLRTLREDGWLNVRRGVTTIEEVLRTTKI